MNQMKVKSIILEALEAENPNQEQQLIRAVYWMAHSLGCDTVEETLRRNIADLPRERYWRVQERAITHLIRNVSNARTAPLLPEYKEIGDWEIEGISS